MLGGMETEIYLAMALGLLISYFVIRLAVAHAIGDALGKAQISHHVADIRTVVTEVLRQSARKTQGETEPDVG